MLTRTDSLNIMHMWKGHGDDVETFRFGYQLLSLHVTDLYWISRAVIRLTNCACVVAEGSVVSDLITCFTTR